MKSPRIQLALAVAMISALTLSACADGGSTEGTQAGTTQGGDENSQLVSDNKQDRNSLEQGGTLTLPIASLPTNFNRFHVGGNLADWTTVTNATDPSLFLYSPEGELSPRTEYLQEMPKVEDKDGKKVITYKLNPQAVWNDGTKIDWTAFEATWKTMKEPVDTGGYNNLMTAGYEDIESVEQGVNAEEVVVTMAKPFFPVTEMFWGLVHPKVAESADAFNTLMKDDVHAELRSGPFTFDKIDRQAGTITLKPNDNWWGNKPLLDQVVFRQMEDSATIPAFKNGEIDVTGVANKARLEQIQGAPDLDLRRSQLIATNVYVFNSKAPILSDINVRKALWQGIDREQIKQVRFNGLDYTEKPVNSAMFYSFMPEAQDNMPVQFDAAAAEQTLQDAGYAKGSDGIYTKDGKKLTVKYTTFGDDPLTTATGQTVQNQLKAIGVDLQLDVRPSSAFAEALEKGDFDFLSMSWGSGSPNPVNAVYYMMGSDSSSNYGNVGTAELDARMKVVGQIEDYQQQVDEINAIEKEWLALYGQMPLWSGPVISASRQGLANYGPALFQSITPKWEDVGWEQGSNHQ